MVQTPSLANMSIGGLNSSDAPTESRNERNNEAAATSRAADRKQDLLSPLEIIDQTDDDEKLLQALQGLTLDSGLEEEGDH